MEEFSRNRTISSTGRRIQTKYFPFDSYEENHENEELNFEIENNLNNNKLEEKDKLLKELKEKLEHEKNEKYKMELEIINLKKKQFENVLNQDSKKLKNFLEKSEIKNKWFKFAKNDITENFLDFSPLQTFHLISELFLLCSDLLQKLLKEKLSDVLKFLNIPNTDYHLKNIKQDLKYLIMTNIENIIFNKKESEKFLLNFKNIYFENCLKFIKNKEGEFEDFINDNSFKSMLDGVKNIILFGMFNEPILHFEIEKDYSKRKIEEIVIQNNREKFIIVNDPGSNNFTSILLLNPPVTISGNEISDLSDLKKIIIKYDKNDTLDDFSKSETDVVSNKNNDSKDSSNFINNINKPNSQSSVELIKNKDIDQIPKYETNTGTKLFDINKFKNPTNPPYKNSFGYDILPNSITSRLENKKKFKNKQNKCKLKEFSGEHEHLQTDIKEFTNDNIFFNPLNISHNKEKIKRIHNKFEYDKIFSSHNKNIISNKNLENTKHIYNSKKILTKKKSTINMNLKREKLICTKRVSSNNPKKFITKKSKDKKNINPGTTRPAQTTKKFFNTNVFDNLYSSETILSSPGKDISIIKKIKENKSKLNEYYRIDSENSINQKTECHIQNVNINLININQTNRVITQKPKKDRKSLKNDIFIPTQYFDLNEVEEVSNYIKDGINKNKTLIVRVKKGKNNCNEKEIMISTGLGQNEDTLTDNSNQYLIKNPESNLINSKNKHSLLKLNKGNIQDNIRMESPSSFSKNSYLINKKNNNITDDVN